MTILIYLILIIILLVYATVKYKLHPFLSLLFASVLIGLLSGLNSIEVIEALKSGFGDTLRQIGIIIVFGTIIGQYLEKSGGTKRIAEILLKAVGEKKSPLVMSITGFIVSIPVFCDSGFVILSSLTKAISRRTGISLSILAVALGTGLYATHVFVPPTPGPLAAAATLHADVGLVLIYGLIVAIPAVFAGLFWAQYSGNKYRVEPDAVEVEDEITSSSDYPKWLPFAPIVLPIILIALRSIAEFPSNPFGEGTLKSLFIFMGDPFIALLIGVIASFSLKRNSKETSHSDWISSGLKSAGVIILITGAGGAFGNVLRATNLGEILGSTLTTWNAGIALPFIIAALLKSAQGSSTVAIITTAAIISPLLATLGLDGATGKALTVLAVGAGAMTVSHINDSYFWVVSQFSGMDLATTLKTHTSATLMQGIASMVIIYLLSAVLL